MAKGTMMGTQGESPMGMLVSAMDCMRIAQEEINVAICSEHFYQNRGVVQGQARKAADELTRAAKKLRILSGSK